ncbi:hypothetical protein HOP50_08g51610 [Chloropicon primus]|uniref:Uncharacterized protein n=1 Tax=Chloropicon primus TaxID=1764295 RepID=A0A5B8MQ56_9CHLO|nr:hypothetical protein A3770_08p51340 [Chloropicon primus]UPR01838.1 hypothetical protein HOP50_08g51610 [Chloropicon primus]|eukprot:QDZ22616.1 hypothetical protein A3770_08p51340 [Chloropicon primus]
MFVAVVVVVVCALLGRVAKAQDVGAALGAAGVGQASGILSDFFCADGTSSGAIDFFEERSSGGFSSLLNSIFGLGLETGYRYAVQNGGLPDGWSGC